MSLIAPQPDDRTDTAQPELTWSPEPGERTRMHGFMEFLDREGIVSGLSDYRALWEWSVQDLSGFWDALRRYFDVIGTGFSGPALAEERMPGARWYEHASVNLSENVLRPALTPERRHELAILDVSEDNEMTRWTWAELADWVARCADHFRRLGIGAGDRVIGVLPNTPEAIVGMLAAASIGAVWSICSPDLAPEVIESRMAQLAPKALVTTASYRYNGKRCSLARMLSELVPRLTSLEHVFVVPDPARSSGDSPDTRDTPGPQSTPAPWGEAPPVHAFPSQRSASQLHPEFVRVPFDHPLWVLFSSGTTGTPKGIVHGHGGILLESLKNIGLAQDMGEDDLYYVAANTSWMVWNTLVSNLAAGAAVVTYSGSPTFGAVTRQFDIIERTGATMFGVGAAYLSLVEKSGAEPLRSHDLSRLRAILSTGSPLPPSTWRWVHAAVKPDVRLGSDSGGTDICSGFVGTNPISPIYLGESQGPLLGVLVESWNTSGTPTIGEVGEMVITRPLPSMPLYLWGDEDFSRYRESYFAEFDGVWAQGDWITETPRHGFIVHGRSDATLNRQGVRLGSGDIYSALQDLDAVTDSVVIGVELAGGEYWMPLFVSLADGQELDERLEDTIRHRIRASASARHVPDEIIACPEIPVTHTGKRIEVPLKKLFSGHAIDLDVVRGTLRRPGALDWFAEFARARDTGV